NSLIASRGNTFFDQIVQTGPAGFTDNVSYSIAGLPGDATGTFSPSSVAGGGKTTLAITLPADVPAGFYPLTVTGTDNVGGATQAVSVSLIVQPSTGGALPSDWNDADINSTPPGSSSFGGGVFAIQAGGTGIDYGGQDQFNFMFSAINGDGTVVARLLQLPDSAQAGIMIREGLGPNAQNAYLVANNGVLSLYYRSNTS